MLPKMAAVLSWYLPEPIRAVPLLQAKDSSLCFRRRKTERQRPHRQLPVVETRIEGETCKYFSAFINADKCDGFTIAGPGTIDGNGYHYWEEFWIRRTWNRECTNKDAQRPRLVYISNSSNVTLQDVHIQNSPFWTNHIYRCDHVRFLGCTIFAPTSGMRAPSSDAIDIDVCHDVLVDGCYMSVNDDAIAIKGGKGTWADQAPENGPVYNVLIRTAPMVECTDA